MGSEWLAGEGELKVNLYIFLVPQNSTPEFTLPAKRLSDKAQPPLSFSFKRAPVLENVKKERIQRNERGVTGFLNNKKRGHTVPYGQRLGEQQSTNNTSSVCLLWIFPRQIQCSLGVE